MTEPSHPPFVPPVSPSRVIESSADDARERVIRVLTDAYAYDIITDVEFERRLEQLGLSTTPASIAAVVADLPSSVVQVRQAHPGYLPLAEGRIVGFLSETRRKGPWRVPSRLQLRAFLCDMRIDLRYAAIPAGCTIEINSFMANVSLIVPPDMIVDFNVDSIIGSAGSDADGGSMAGHGAAHIRVNGSAILSDVRVRVRRTTR